MPRKVKIETPPPNKKKPNPIDRHVGARVRMRRLMLDKTQTELGEALGLTFQQVQKYEKGTNRIGSSRLQHIANILEVPISFFFDNQETVGAFSGSTATPAYVQEFMSTGEGIDLCKAYMNISNLKVRKLIVQLVEQLVAK